MSVKKGDFVLIDYVARVKETGEAFDTTIEKVARDEGVFDDASVYEPKLVAVGQSWVLKSLDDALPGLKVGKTSKIEIPPEKGFGPRDPKKIKLVPLRMFRRQETPHPGMQVEINGKTAVIRAVGAGRVQVDFNPPLAGKTLVYDLTVRKQLKEKKEIVRSMIHRRIQSVKGEDFKLKLTTKKLSVELPKEAFYLEGIQFAKRGITNDIRKLLPEIKTVTFIETFKEEANQVTDVKKTEQETSPASK